jgi:dolichol-phosphate mannosyltransferase
MSTCGGILFKHGMINIVFPVYNEAKSLPQLELAINDIALRINYNIECIFVNDGSLDESWLVLREIVLRNKNYRAINFSRNFGHQAAISAGISIATGDAVIMMDSDLQHPLEIIPKLIEKWEEGFDIVNTSRTDSGEQGFFKELSSRFFYKIFNSLSEIQLKPGSADFRLLSAKVVKVLIELNEVDRFYRGLVPWVGFKSAFVNYAASPRKHGQSNYTMNKMLSLAMSGMSSFSTRPLQLIFMFGAALFFISLLGLLIVSTFKYILGSDLFTGTAVLIFIILITNAIQLIAIGILSYFIYGIIKEIKRRPAFIVQEQIESSGSTELANFKKAD